MREYRVWVWDKMLDVATIDWCHRQGVHPWDKTATDGLGEVYQFTKFDDCILIQYTGLKDKDGKKIWEGDVLEWANERTPSNERHIVKFGFHSTSDDYYASTAYGFYMEREDLKIDETHSGEYFGKCRIIGNIYENPEMVKEESYRGKIF